MSGRFKRLFETEKNLYSKGSPIIICAAVLHKDNAADKVVAQIKYKNISQKNIKSITVLLTLLDSADRVLDDKALHTYLDLTMKRDDETGEKELITLTDNNARAFSIKVSEVVFEDKTVWTAESGAEWKSLPEPKPLSSLINEDELVCEYRRECRPNSNIIPEKIGDLWRCSCAAWNLSSEETCHACKLSFKEQTEKLDKESLRANLTQFKTDTTYENGIAFLKSGKNRENIEDIEKAISYFQTVSDYKDAKEKQAECEKVIAEIKEKEEKRREEKRIEKERLEALKMEEAERRRKKTIKAISIAAPILAAVIVVVVLLNTVIMPSVNYNKALSLIEEKEYEESYGLLYKLGDYKDAKELLKDFVSVPVKKTTKEKAGGEETTTYTYDGSGRKIKEYFTDSNNRYFITYTYDDSAKRMYESCHYYTEADEGYYRTWEYDKNGNVIKERRDDNDGRWSESEYTYDSRGDMIKEKNIYQSMDNDSIELYTKWGWEIKELETTETRYEYRYDDEGKLTGVIRNGSTEKIYEYDKRGNCVKEWYRGRSDRIQYRYDKNNKCIEKKEGDETTIYEYDEYENLIKEETDESITEYSGYKVYYCPQK